MKTSAAVQLQKEQEEVRQYLISELAKVQASLDGES